MGKFNTPFFFSYDDELVVTQMLHENNFEVYPYRIACMYNEIIYWLTYNTSFQDSLLRMKTPGSSHPKPSITFGSHYVGAKIYITFDVTPEMDPEATASLQNFINETVMLRTDVPYLLLDSNMPIINQGTPIDPSWMSDAIELLTCDAGYNSTRVASPDIRSSIEHFTIKDAWTTRLYTMLDGDNNETFITDDRSFDEKANYILNTAIMQLTEMWKLGFIKGAQLLMNAWPLEDMNNGWCKPIAGTILSRCMPQPSIFYTNILKGSNIVRWQLPCNYAIYYHIAHKLKEQLYSFRFTANQLEVTIANYSQCKSVNQTVEEALRTHSKVIEIYHDHIDLLESEMLVIGINNTKVGLVPIDNNAIGYQKRQAIIERLDLLASNLKEDGMDYPK